MILFGSQCIRLKNAILNNIQIDYIIILNTDYVTLCCVCVMLCLCCVAPNLSEMQTLPNAVEKKAFQRGIERVVCLVRQIKPHHNLTTARSGLIVPEAKRVAAHEVPSNARSTNQVTHSLVLAQWGWSGFALAQWG